MLHLLAASQKFKLLILRQLIEGLLEIGDE